MGKEVHLANLSFVDPNWESMKKKIDIPFISGEDKSVKVWKIEANNGFQNSTYFPEAYLAQWFHEKHGEDVPVWLFKREGYLKVKEAYKVLLEHLGDVDCIVCVDGGTDSLMKGDENGVG